MFNDDIKEKLRAPLKKEVIAVHTIANKKGLKYLEGFHIIDELNRIFGHDGWEGRILSTPLIKDLVNANKTQGLAVNIIYELSVFDGEKWIVRQDVGGAISYGGDYLENAFKSACTDALKRCARTFGNQFGNELYDKDFVVTEPVKNEQDEKQKYGVLDENSSQFNKIIEALKLKKSIKELEEAQKSEGYLDLFKKLNKNAQDTVNLNLNDMKASFQ